MEAGSILFLILTLSFSSCDLTEVLIMPYWKRPTAHFACPYRTASGHYPRQDPASRQARETFRPAYCTRYWIILSRHDSEGADFPSKRNIKLRLQACRWM